MRFAPKQKTCSCGYEGKFWGKLCGRCKAKKYAQRAQEKKQKENVNKATGEKLLFVTLWNTRSRFCFISGQLIKKFDVQNFAHILPKGAYPKYRLLDRNIVLMTPENHHKQHSVAKSDLIKQGQRWADFFALQDELRIEYNQKFK